MSTIALTEFDAETRFRAMAAQRNIEEGLTILDKLDRYFANNIFVFKSAIALYSSIFIYFCFKYVIFGKTSGCISQVTS